MTNFLNSLTWVDYTTFSVIIFMIILLVLFRENKVVKPLVSSFILDAEKNFNSKEGQLKLTEVKERIKNSKLPWLVKLLFSNERLLVTYIEWVLNGVSKFFKTGIEVDIIGNDGIKTSTKIDLGDVNRVEIKGEFYGQESTKNMDNSTKIYGKVIGETDFKGKNNGRIEVGIEKKI